MRSLYPPGSKLGGIADRVIDLISEDARSRGVPELVHVPTVLSSIAGCFLKALTEDDPERGAILADAFGRDVHSAMRQARRKAAN